MAAKKPRAAKKRPPYIRWLARLEGREVYVEAGDSNYRGKVILMEDDCLLFREAKGTVCIIPFDEITGVEAHEDEINLVTKIEFAEVS